MRGLCILSFLIFFSCNSNYVEEPNAYNSKFGEKDLEQVKALMAEQEEAWNNGDIEGFMKHYWNSDSLLFIGKSGVNYGWQTTLDNYKNSYNSSEEMGQLTFHNLIVRFIDDHTIQVIGKWNLSRKPKYEDIGGSYSLLWKNKDDRWVIVSDHSSG